MTDLPPAAQSVLLALLSRPVGCTAFWLSRTTGIQRHTLRAAVDTLTWRVPALYEHTYPDARWPRLVIDMDEYDRTGVLDHDPRDDPWPPADPLAGLHRATMPREWRRWVP